MNISRLYLKYLREKSGLSNRSICKYYEQVPANYDVIQTLKKHAGVSNMYCITDVAILEDIRDEIRQMDLDKVGNHMYSCGVAQYIKFLKQPIYSVVSLLENAE